MKNTIIAIFFLLNAPFLVGQELDSSGENSPAVIAKNLSITYGVRTDAIEAILWIYEAEGYDEERRKRATEQILREYAQSPEKKQKANKLSVVTRQRMGISKNSGIANALEWDLFARSHYLSTTAPNSPAVVAKGDVNIWYGIPPKALRALATQLEKNKTELSNFETQLTEQVKKYEELKTELETYGAKEEIYQQAEALLEEGKLEEAEQLIESDFEASMKRQAYKGYIYGKTKALLLKYNEAAKGYKNAVNNDEGNFTYHLYYADNENTLANYDEAIRHYEIAFSIDGLQSDNEEKIAALFNNLGLAWLEKGEYDKAIGYYKKVLQINLKFFGDQHPNLATGYNNLGEVWREKGEYDRAIGYYEKALQIFLFVFGDQHPNVAAGYNNLGLAFHGKGEYDKAMGYYEKALQINLKFFGDQHPNVAIDYNNLGRAWHAKGEYDKEIRYYEKALQILLAVFGDQHPKLAMGYNNLGSAWLEKGEYDKAIGYYKKALQINLKFFGNQHLNVAGGYNSLGLVWHSKGDYDKAIGYFEKALQIVLNAFGDQHPKLAVGYSSLGLVWHSKGDYDKAIGYFEKALKILLAILGDQHPNVAKIYNNLGDAWREKGDYDKAIGYFEKVLKIDLKVFGNQHPDVATLYNNLGLVWHAKKEYDKAIAYCEKALQIDLKAFGNQHPNVARDYNNLGSAWREKGKYNNAIGYYEKALQILNQFFPLTHPHQKTIAQNLSSAANSRGMEVFGERKYQEALGYFQKALQNAEKAQDNIFSLTCLNNVGSMQKNLKLYEEGLQNLNAGLEKAASINRQIDQYIKEQMTPEMLKDPEIQNQIAAARNLDLIRRMRYHKIGCLKGLEKHQEADGLAKQLWQEGIEANNTSLLEDLKKEGYDFGN